MNMRVLISSLVAAMCLICSNAIACEDSEVAHPHSGQSGELDSGAVVDLEIEMIKARVLRQCGLSSKLADRDERMYGMWFVNYLPYFQISLAYSELGEWDKAWDAIRMSEEMVEFSPGDFEYDRFATLKALIEQNRQLPS